MRMSILQLQIFRDGRQIGGGSTSCTGNRTRSLLRMEKMPRMETWRVSINRRHRAGRSVSDLLIVADVASLLRTHRSSNSIRKLRNRSGVTIVESHRGVLSDTVPVFQFRDLDEIVTHRICMNIVPVSVFTAQVRITDYTVLVPITIRVQNKDVTWSTGSTGRRKTLNLYGRITSQNGRIEDIFEKTMFQNSDQAYEDFTFRLHRALAKRHVIESMSSVKDVAEDRKGTWSGTITVP